MKISKLIDQSEASLATSLANQKQKIQNPVSQS